MPGIEICAKTEKHHVLVSLSLISLNRTERPFPFIGMCFNQKLQRMKKRNRSRMMLDDKTFYNNLQ